MPSYRVRTDCVSADTHASRLMQPAYAAMAISVLMAFPLNIHPCRFTLDVMVCEHLCGAGDSRKLLRHVAWTCLIATSGLLVALYVPGINIVFQLMGSTSSAFVCYVLPAAFALRLPAPPQHKKARLSLSRAPLGNGIGAVRLAVVASSDGCAAGCRERSAV